MTSAKGAALRALLLGAAACALVPTLARADDAGDGAVVSGVDINGQSGKPITTSPATTESLGADDVRRTVNAVNVEDSLKYLPDILIRKRHVGDTQAPMTTRTSGVGASARSLVFADGVPLSALIGNNNSNASPRWGMVSPEEVSRIDVLYGPFSAAYAGNSVGAVVNITTRLPARLEGSLKVAGSWDRFSLYSTRDTFPAAQLAATLGDRWGDVSWFLSANHVHSQGQPLTLVTAARSASPSLAGTPVTGATQDLNRTGAVIQVLGVGGLEDQTQDTFKAKVSWSPGPALRLTWMGGLLSNDTAASAQTYLRNAAGDPVYSGSLNIGGYTYSVAAGAFAGGVYRLREAHWMNALTARGSVGSGFDWQATASLYDYGQDEQRAPSSALPGSLTGGAGSIVRLDGTGWTTFDLSANWRPAEGHEISFGYHGDRYRLSNLKFNAAGWPSGAPTGRRLPRQDPDRGPLGAGRHRPDAGPAADPGRAPGALAGDGRLQLFGLARPQRQSTGPLRQPLLAKGHPALDAGLSLAADGLLRRGLAISHRHRALSGGDHRADSERSQPRSQTRARPLDRAGAGAGGFIRAGAAVAVHRGPGGRPDLPERAPGSRLLHPVQLCAEHRACA
jgi:iron complex outermembrane receptor protein